VIALAVPWSFINLGFRRTVVYSSLLVAIGAVVKVCRVSLQRSLLRFFFANGVVLRWFIVSEIQVLAAVFLHDRLLILVFNFVGQGLYSLFSLNLIFQLLLVLDRRVSSPARLSSLPSGLETMNAHWQTPSQVSLILLVLAFVRCTDDAILTLF
jgi:hypothetical protein